MFFCLFAYGLLLHIWTENNSSPSVFVSSGLLIVNFSSVLQPSNDFIAGCFIPVSKAEAWGRFSVFAAVG